MSPAGDPTSRQRLLELADQVASAPDPEPSRRRAAILGAAAVLAVLFLGIGAAVVFSNGDGDRSAAGEVPVSTDATEAPDGTVAPDGTDDPTDEVADTATTPAPTTAPTTTAPTTTAPTTVPATTAPATTAPATTAAAPTETPAAAAGTDTTAGPATTVAAVADPAASSDPVRWANFSGGKVYLQGVVPDQATADEVRDKAAAVVGPDNVVVEYEIVPGAPRPPSAPLYVRDSVLFARGSVDINATARGVLDLGVVLMTQNPQVTIDISGHTDADGTDEANQLLSERRVQVILDHLVSRGIDPNRLTTAAFGESRPIADNATATGRAANRRVEFQINNLLG